MGTQQHLFPLSHWLLPSSVSGGLLRGASATHFNVGNFAKLLLVSGAIAAWLGASKRWSGEQYIVQQVQLIINGSSLAPANTDKPQKICCAINMPKRVVTFVGLGQYKPSSWMTLKAPRYPPPQNGYQMPLSEPSKWLGKLNFCPIIATMEQLKRKSRAFGFIFEWR